MESIRRIEGNLGPCQRRYKKRGEKIVFIDFKIAETLTPTTCTRILTEISKYIVCHKLIPYPYDALKHMAQSAEKFVLSEKKKSLQSRRHHKKMIEAYDNFENIFKNIELELQSCVASGDEIEEVVLLLGATIRSPQEMYRFKLPPIICQEPIHKQEERILLHLIRCIVLSEDFNDMLSHSLSPTNMFVMLKKKEGKSSEWFMPKDSYDLPRCSRQAVINLTNLTESQISREDVPDVPISKQESNNNVQSECVTLSQEPLSQMMVSLRILPPSSRWFQSHILLKGFRFLK